jgi:uncharacterized protein YcbK (DUF882 family)
MQFARRSLLKGAIGALAGVAGATPAGAHLDAPRSLALLNLHTGERLRATFFEAGGYVPDALSALDHLLRDFRTGDSHPMAPRLLDLVATLSGTLAPGQEVHVISGYRSPQTNAALHAHSDGVAAHSLHMQGQAMDIRLPSVALGQLRDTALALAAGGVGFYPTSDFVHVDVGRIRRW